MLVSGAVDTNIKLWDLRKWNCVQTIKSHSKPINAIDISNGGEMIASGGSDGLIKASIIVCNYRNQALVSYGTWEWLGNNLHNLPILKLL